LKTLAVLALLVASATVTAGADLSVQVWVRTTSESTQLPLIAGTKDWDSGTIEDYTTHHELGLSRSSGALPGWALALQPDGSWCWNLGDGSNRLDYRPTPARQPLNDGAWHHLAFSIDAASNAAWLYHDGRSVAVYSTADLGDTAGAELRSGFDGTVDSLSVTQELLTAKDVATIWRAGRPGGDSVPPPATAPAPAPAAEPVTELNVLAWNIWHGGRRDGNELGLLRTVAAIRASGADVIAMQETYGSGPAIADALGFSFHLRSSNLSVMSRFPIVAVHDLYEPFRLGGVTLELSPGQELTVFSLWIHYLPSLSSEVSPHNSADDIVAAEWETRGSEARDILKALAPHIARSDEVPLIVAGDFNSPSHLDWTFSNRAIHSGRTVPWPVSVQMDEAGFVDTYRVVHPDPREQPGRTWSPRFLDAWQDRIDYIYTHGPLLAAFDAAMIDSVELETAEGLEARWPSDHAAVLGSFWISAPGR
jgi:endonuclease/exonuclease/phosphatase family metal-dependent hydrolase